MKVDLLASETHFVDHLVPVYLALPPELRGKVRGRGTPTLKRFAELGLKAFMGTLGGPDPVLVASFGDLKRAKNHNRQHVILMEHGAGQSYGGTTSSDGHGSYAGGKHRNASMFLHPGPHPAARDRLVHPETPIEIIGSPFLDLLPAHEQAPEPVIAVSTHFDAVIAPEATSGFSSFSKQIARLSKVYKVLGHGHPRIVDRLAAWYAKVGIEVVKDFREVARRADVFVADNTSAMFAFAATGRQVVVLNPPQYRRNVHHGLRFWEASTVGVNVSIDDDLVDAVARALECRPEDVEARERALDLVYGYRSGAAARAAGVLTSWIFEHAPEDRSLPGVSHARPPIVGERGPEVFTPVLASQAGG